MKNFHISLSVVIFYMMLIVLSGCSQTPDPTQSEKEIRELVSNSVEMFKQKDVAKLVNRFTTDGNLKITGAPLVTGHEALKKNYENTVNLENFKITLNITKVEIAKSGDLAYAMGEYHVSFNVPGKQIVDKGITVLVLKKEKDGWKIATENLSSYPEE